MVYSIRTRGPLRYPSRSSTQSRRAPRPYSHIQRRAALAPLRMVYRDLPPANSGVAGEGSPNEHCSSSRWRLVHWRGGTKSRSRGLRRRIWLTESGCDEAPSVRSERGLVSITRATACRAVRCCDATRGSATAPSVCVLWKLERSKIGKGWAKLVG